MSALTASRPPLHPVIIPDSAPLQESLSRKQQFAAAPSSPPFIPPTASPESSYSTLPSLTHSCASSSSSSSSLHSVPERTNEHLAILLPKALWKPDSQASKCDNLYCRVRFSLFERKHHCRKCGGVFCASCTTRTTGLLDTSNLSFLHPPRNVPLTTYESPESPILNSRVCDDCWDQLHGNPSTPHTPELIRPSLSRLLSSPMSMIKSPLSLSPASSSPSSLSSSADALPDLRPRRESSRRSTASPVSRHSRSLCATPSAASLDGLSRSTVRGTQRSLTADLPKRSYGELDAYPLRHSSVLCKATGGGRWTPKHDKAIIGQRPPVLGAKASYEIDLEQEEREEKLRRENPIIKDGDFQYRFQCQRDAPLTVVRASFSTF